MINIVDTFHATGTSKQPQRRLKIQVASNLCQQKHSLACSLSSMLVAPSFQKRLMPRPNTIFSSKISKRKHPKSNKVLRWYLSREWVSSRKSWTTPPHQLETQNVQRVKSKYRDKWSNSLISNILKLGGTRRVIRALHVIVQWMITRLSWQRISLKSRLDRSLAPLSTSCRVGMPRTSGASPVWLLQHTCSKLEAEFLTILAEATPDKCSKATF